VHAYTLSTVSLAICRVYNHLEERAVGDVSHYHVADGEEMASRRTSDAQ